MKIIDKKKFREYYQTNRRSIGIAGIFLIIAYGIKMFQIMFSHDTEAIISVPDSLYDSWMTMGRYGLIFCNAWNCGRMGVSVLCIVRRDRTVF